MEYLRGSINSYGVPPGVIDFPKINSSPRIKTIKYKDLRRRCSTLVQWHTYSNLEQLKKDAATSLKTMQECDSRNGLKMNSNKTKCILFATPNFSKWTESFQITIDDTVKQTEEKVINMGVIFDSRLSFEHHIKSLCSGWNCILYLNKVQNTLDQKSRTLLINGLIFSYLNYCSSMWGKFSEKLPYEVQKCINFTAKVASNGKYLKRDHVTPLLRDWKWINFGCILRLNESSFMCIKICTLQQIQIWRRLTLTSETKYHRE